MIFASDQPVPRDVLGRVVGARCNLDLLLAELEADLAARPYQLVRVAGGYALRTRPEHRDAIRTAFPDLEAPPLTKLEATVLMTIGYYQPVTRDQVGWILGHRVEGRQIDRDLIGRLRRLGLIANGPRSPEPGAPILYVTTPAFLKRVRAGLSRPAARARDARGSRAARQSPASGPAPGAGAGIGVNAARGSRRG